MGKTIQVRIDESLAQILEKIRREVATDLKKKYGLDEITIHGTLSSKILAAKMQGLTYLNFKVKKSGPRKGILEL